MGGIIEETKYTFQTVKAGHGCMEFDFPIPILHHQRERGYQSTRPQISDWWNSQTFASDCASDLYLNIKTKNLHFKYCL